ncbi:MAG: murein biosynthesis integral membrane protein MurJ [Pseudomonadota bacterium]
MAFFRAIATVGGFTLASRLMGFIRDVLTAGFLGAGPVADAFFIALKLPNFFRRITAEGAFSVSFVPMFSKVLADEGAEEARKFAEEAQAVMLAALFPFTVVCMVAMPWVLYVLAPGVHGDPVRFDLAVHFSRITFPYILMMSLTALLGGVLNSFGRFAAFAAAPMFFNGILIAALVFGRNLFETSGHALAWGLAAAGVAQFVWMLWNYKSIGYVLKPRWPVLTPRIRKLYKLMIPGALGAGAAQINLFIDMILASLLPVGSISFLYYADRLYQLPLGVIGVAIGTALLPMLSRALKGGGGNGNEDDPAKLLGMGFETGLVLSLPAAIGLTVIAGPIMSVLFERGAFSHADSLQSSYALVAYAIGLPAYVLSRVFSTAYFAREDTTTPVRFAVVCAVINTALALALILPLKHVGIALATGITAWVNLALLMRGLHKKKHLDLPPHSVKRMWKILACGLVMAAVVWGLNTFVMKGILSGSQLRKAINLTVLIAAGGVSYFSCLYFFGIFGLRSIKALFPKRKKQDTIRDVRQFGE